MNEGNPQCTKTLEESEILKSEVRSVPAKMSKTKKKNKNLEARADEIAVEMLSALDDLGMETISGKKKKNI